MPAPLPASSTKRIAAWQTPATAYPDARHGAAEIVSEPIEPGLYLMYGLADERGDRHFAFKATRPLPQKLLKIDGEVWMVDDPPHFYAMRDHAAAMTGHVLVAGLGLGLIVHALADNPQVRSVTVVERHPDVLALVGPLVARAGVELLQVQADWWDYQPTGPVDSVFFDLLVGEGRQLIPEALRATIDIRQRFGNVPARVHGFDNNWLFSEAERVAAVGEAAAAQFARLVGGSR